MEGKIKFDGILVCRQCNNTKDNFTESNVCTICGYGTFISKQKKEREKITESGK